MAELAPDTTLDSGARLARMRAAVAGNREMARLYEKVVAGVPWARLDEIVERRGAQSGFEGPLKYLDCAFWLHHKLIAARRLGLAIGPPRRILDIGMGCGHFSHVCARLGHDVVGIDLADPLYEEVCAVLGVRRITHRVTIEAPIPGGLGRFDLVTAFAAQFDYVSARVWWSAEDWRSAIGTILAAHMNPGGRLHFRVNPMLDIDTGRIAPKDHLRAVARSFRGAYRSGGALDIVRRQGPPP